MYHLYIFFTILLIEYLYKSALNTEPIPSYFCTAVGLQSWVNDDDDDDDDDEDEEDDDDLDVLMMMLMVMWNRKTDPKTGKHTLCEAAQ